MRARRTVRLRTLANARDARAAASLSDSTDTQLQHLRARFRTRSRSSMPADLARASTTDLLAELKRRMEARHPSAALCTLRRL